MYPDLNSINIFLNISQLIALELHDYLFIIWLPSFLKQNLHDFRVKILL